MITVKKLLFISNRVEDNYTGASIVSKLNLYYLQEVLGVDNVFNISMLNKKSNLVDKINKTLKVLITHRVDGISLLKEREIISCIKENNIGIVFLDGSLFGHLAKKIKSYDEKVVIITFFHDICFDWVRSIAQKNIKFKAMKKTISKNEKLCSIFSDTNIFLNLADKNRFEEIYGFKAKTEIISVAINDYLEKVIIKSDMCEKPYILFVGANYKPNIDGVKWYLEYIYPESKLPLHVVGKNMEKYKKFFHRKGVVLISNASDDELKKEYQNASYIISPIFSGGGMKVKVAEALMYGKTVLGTSVSFEGYELTDDMWKADNLQQFIAFTKEMNDAFLNGKPIFSAVNRKNYEKNHSIKINKEKMKKLILNCNY